MPAQPTLAGNDGYGRVKGASTQRDLVRQYDASGNFTEIAAVHQINNTEKAPQLYFPREESVQPGDVWRLSYAVHSMVLKSAGAHRFRVNAQWYTETGTYIGQDEGPWFNNNDFQPAPQSRVSGDFTAPANAGRLNVVAEMQTSSPYNTWAIWDVQYAKGPFPAPTATIVAQSSTPTPMYQRSLDVATPVVTTIQDPNDSTKYAIQVVLDPATAYITDDLNNVEGLLVDHPEWRRAQYSTGPQLQPGSLDWGTGSNTEQLDDLGYTRSHIYREPGEYIITVDFQTSIPEGSGSWDYPFKKFTLTIT